MCVFLISPVPITEPLTSELIDTPVFHKLAPRPIKYRVSVPIPSYYQFKLLLSKLRESSIYHWVNTQGERGGNTERKRLRTSLERERTCVYFSTRGSEKNPTAQHSKNPNPCFCFWEYMGKCVCVCVFCSATTFENAHNCLYFWRNKHKHNHWPFTSIPEVTDKTKLIFTRSRQTFRHEVPFYCHINTLHYRSNVWGF